MKKIIYLSLILLVVSCRKDEKITASSIVSAEDNSIVEAEFTSIYDVADDFSSNDRRVRSGNTILPSGAIVQFSDSSFSDGDGIECTIDFGKYKNSIPKGILCLDGRFRAGILHLKTNKRYFEDGFICEIWATENDSFYAGNDEVNLSRIIGNTTINKISNIQFSVVVTGAKIENEKGTWTWNSQRTITKKLDNGPGILGDEFEITGNASGKNRKGDDYTVQIDQPLYKKIERGCARTFISGKITLTNLNSSNTIKIDYDPYNNKACDLIAKATIRNREFIYTVR